ncbi:HET-domain-containing protein, partial [Coniochaeta ligniaria NRRL 30616]
MRLLNTTTIELAEFVGEPPPYTILSHTWGDDEVTYQDLDLKPPGAVQKRGYAKILGACNQARVRGPYMWIWIDTCCIDKSSSAELSEAINSMFKWYEKAETCFVYLSDARDVHDEAWFSTSRWFTRGWTLQELLASGDIEFYTSAWQFIGTKATLINQIVAATGIGESHLLRTRPLSSASVAQRMSWASKRKTSREEDLAYCLLGVFGVHMPLIYGEGGTAAFFRLQEEIMRNSNDQSIFAWAWGYGSSEWEITSHLAQSPRDFAHAGDIVRCQVDLPEIDLIATYKGMTLEAPICRYVGSNRREHGGTYYLPIKC